MAPGIKELIHSFLRIIQSIDMDEACMFILASTSQGTFNQECK